MPPIFLSISEKRIRDMGIGLSGTFSRNSLKNCRHQTTVPQYALAALRTDTICFSIDVVTHSASRDYITQTCVCIQKRHSVENYQSIPSLLNEVFVQTVVMVFVPFLIRSELSSCGTVCPLIWPVQQLCPCLATKAMH